MRLYFKKLLLPALKLLMLKKF